MKNKQWYELLFEDYDRKYDQECFAQGTIGEYDFIEQLPNEIACTGHYREHRIKKGITCRKCGGTGHY